MERLADGILGVKHGVATSAIQFLECYYNAATCCYLVDRVIVTRDNTDVVVLFRCPCLVSPHGSLDRLISLYIISSSLDSKRQTTQALSTR